MSQKVVIPSTLPIWYLGNILRWESNGCFHEGRCCVTMQRHLKALGHRTNSSSPTASGAPAATPRQAVKVQQWGRDCAAPQQQGLALTTSQTRLHTDHPLGWIILVSPLPNRHHAEQPHCQCEFLQLASTMAVESGKLSPIRIAMDHPNTIWYWRYCIWCADDSLSAACGHSWLQITN